MAKPPLITLLSAQAEPTFEQIAVGNTNLSFDWEVIVGDVIWSIKANDIKVTINLLDAGKKKASWQSALEINTISSVSIVESLSAKKSEFSQNIQVNEAVFDEVLDNLRKWSEKYQEIFDLIAEHYAFFYSKRIELFSFKSNHLNAYQNMLSLQFQDSLTQFKEEREKEESYQSFYNRIRAGNLDSIRGERIPPFEKQNRSSKYQLNYEKHLTVVRDRKNEYRDNIRLFNKKILNQKSQIVALQKAARTDYPGENIAWPTIPDFIFELPDLPTQPPHYLQADFFENVPLEEKDLKQAIVELTEDTSRVIKAQAEAFKQVLDSSKAEFEQKKDQTFSELDEVYRRLGLDRAKIAAHELSGGYNQTSKGWKKQADQWDVLVKRSSFGLILLVLALITLEIFGFTSSTPGSSLATKLSYTLLGAGFIAYAARSAAKARRQQRIYEQRGVELAMLRDFLAESSPEDRHEIIKTLAPRYFGESLETPPGSQTGAESPAPVEQLLSLLKQVQDIQKPGKSE
jgi:hypothetical protein